MDVIQQLKENQRPFGLMSEEMQAKAREIGKSLFDWWVAGDWTDCPVKQFRSEATYRLRADYEDEPEIVECEIYRQSNDLYYTLAGRCPIYTAFGDPDFIGFKFEDGVVSSCRILYRHQSGYYTTAAVGNIADFTVLHATHVLFRRKKKE